MNTFNGYIYKWKIHFIAALLLTGVFFTLSEYKDVAAKTPPLTQFANYELNDSHFHLTNYIQKGTDINKFLDIMGDKVERVALFGIPLQQQWSSRISGNHAPQYYLETDAPLYYYSFTDAYIAMAYKSLTKEQQNRFDPMITGFNPTDMYAADHIRRVLQTFPGVFSGIGEFTVHKEFVSPKVAGGVASLLDPALDSIFSFAGEAGLAVIIHNDIDVPFAKENEEPAYFKQMKNLLYRHPKTSIIWAHIGLGRIIRPVQSSPTEELTSRNKNQIQLVQDILNDPKLSHVYFDISWDEVAKYIVKNDATVRAMTTLINKFPDRFLFGTDVVAPDNQKEYLQVYYQYDPLWKSLSKETKDKVCKGNYVRIFDQARKKVREWERANVNLKTK
ncbi:MAG: amidohydrolase family protein [Sporocytophaga sp.]|uniref:amidohydrolase family protein n=1 Tax=Sporocytophaga sp. TaxID=2231183 RepID=UPI001B1B56CE|nr:amidohydrolase family protein [Sporocytophaga sp.]MBO9702615.1 amidohydrolase family protein [Sporocytophaga sp.]